MFDPGDAGEANSPGIAHRTQCSRILTLLLCGLALLTAPGAHAADLAVQTALDAQARRIIDEADITYKTTFIWDCKATIWEQILDRPLLMGALWTAYGFAPAYQVSARGDTLHVDDPTGLVGDALLFRRRWGERAYLIHGKLDHWAVPFFNQGTAVIVLKSRPEGDQIVGDIRVYVRANSTLGNIVLKVGRKLLYDHVDNRVTLNLQDARRIVETIDADPTQIAARLRGLEAKQFRSAFMD